MLASAHSVLGACTHFLLHIPTLTSPSSKPETRDANLRVFSTSGGDAILTPSYTARALRSFVELIVSAEFVQDYTVHSFRIYICNALAAADMSDAVIQICLRWASVDALNTYRMTDAKSYAQYLRAAAEASFECGTTRMARTQR